MNIEVSKDNVKITNKEQIHKGEYQANECNFTFSEEYSGLVKKAIFENREEAIEILLVNDKCHIPNEILLGNSIEVNLRVYGYEVEEENGESTLKLRYSPAYTTFMLNRGSYLENTSNTEPITPSDKEQMEQAITTNANNIEDLQNNKQDKLISGENIKTINNQSVLGSGNIEIDLSDYYTKEQTDALIPKALSDLIDDSTHRLVTDTEKNTWNNKSDFSGNYNDLSNKPDLSVYQLKNNLVTSISSSSTDTQYPSAKCVYDIVGNIESILTTLDIGGGV